jgi:hypothetical protein
VFSDVSGVCVVTQLSYRFVVNRDGIAVGEMSDAVPMAPFGRPHLLEFLDSGVTLPHRWVRGQGRARNWDLKPGWNRSQLAGP